MSAPDVQVKEKEPEGMAVPIEPKEKISYVHDSTELEELQ